MVNKPDSEVSPEVLSERRYWEGYIKNEAERAGIDTRGCLGGAILHLMVEEIERLQRSAAGWEETANLETRNKMDREAEVKRLREAAIEKLRDDDPETLTEKQSPALRLARSNRLRAALATQAEVSEQGSASSRAQDEHSEVEDHKSSTSQPHLEVSESDGEGT